MDKTPPSRSNNTNVVESTPTTSLFSPMVPKGGIRRGEGQTPGGPTPSSEAPTRVTRSPSPPPQRAGATALTETIEQLTLSMRRSVCQTLANTNRGRLSTVGALSGGSSLNPTDPWWRGGGQQPSSGGSRPLSVLSMATASAAAVSVPTNANNGNNNNKRYGDSSEQRSVSPELLFSPPQIRTGGSPYSDRDDGTSDLVGRTFLHAGPKEGRHLLINLLSTWGDSFEIGLCGIELYSDKGELLVPVPLGPDGTPSTDGSYVPFSVVSETMLGSAGGSAPAGADAWPGSRSPSIGLGCGASDNTVTDEANQWSSVPMLSGQESVRTALFCDANAMTQGPSQPPHPEDVPSPLKRRHDVSNVVNGNVINTLDESEMYLTPFTDGQHHLICVTFEAPVTIAVLRVFNYCGGGRSKTNKGVRWMEVTFDDELLFRGEVREASASMMPVSLFASKEEPGSEQSSPLSHRGSGESDAAQQEAAQQQLAQQRQLERAQQCFDAAGNCENILFTEDAQVLREVMLQAWCYAKSRVLSKAVSPVVCLSSPSPPTNPPPFTQPRPVGDHCGSSPQRVFSFPSRHTSLGKRTNPLMLSFATASLATAHLPKYQNPNMGTVCGAATVDEAPVRSAYPELCPTGVTSLCLCIRSTWGDAAQVGLSALRLRSPTGQVLDPATTVAQCYLEWPSGSGRRRDSTGNSPPNVPINNFDESVNSPNASVQDEVDEKLLSQYLFATSLETALSCLWRFEPGMQLIVTFQSPQAIGWVDVVNYAAGKRTHCGMRSVRMFISTKVGLTASERRCEYAYLWDEGVDVTPLRSRDVRELTPSEGVVLRKAPATPMSLGALRFQTFDLSEASQGSSLTASLSASVALRATTDMRRARQSLLARPEWLNVLQPCVTPLLPVGYVFKVVLGIAARRSAPPPQLPTASSSSTVPTAAAALKAFVRPWVAQPSVACSFLQDDGAPVDPSQLFCEGLLAFQEGPEGINDLLVTVTLTFVSDQAFVVSAVQLHPPLLSESLTVSRDGSTQSWTSLWVRQVSIAADDVKMYDSSMAEHPNVSVAGGPSSVVFFTLDDRILNRFGSDHNNTATTSAFPQY